MNTNLLHTQVWKRYVRMPYGHLLDFADPEGNVDIPTAEECRKSIPNVLGWGTSIENGAFFGGLYLYGLCHRYNYSPSEKLKSEIEIIADGLMLLCDVGKVDGFIARGVADDGISHYPFSSEDQVGPWLLGLWKFTQSAACDEKSRKNIEQRIIRTLRGLLLNNWNVPTEWHGVYRGSYAHRDWRGAAKCLFCARLAMLFGLIDNDEFERLAIEKPDDGLFTRYEIISHGFGADMVRNTGLIQFWIDVCAHLMTAELAELDQDHASYFISGMKTNGIICSEFINDYKKYIAQAGKPFNYNWREIIPGIRQWSTPDEAVSEAGRQLGDFNKNHCPAMHGERNILLQAITGAWIAAVCGDNRIEQAAYNSLSEMTEQVNWSDVSMNYVFAVEAAIYTYEGRNIK